ncbi:MAG: site-specific integrase [Chloroflexota bacterium]|nr:site-specific integrase [Chloroflexota bacterium]
MTKRRGHNEGSIYQRDSDGRWVGAISLPNGKRKSLYGKTRKEVQDKLRAAFRDAESGLDLTSRQQTVGQYMTRWLEDVAKPGVRPSTFKSYESYVRLHIVPALGRHHVAKLTPQDVQAFLNAKVAAGLAPRTVQQIRAILRRALRQAQKWGLVARNVATLVDPPRSVRTHVQPLSGEQARRLIDHATAQNDRLWPLLCTAILTGLRQGELFGLRWEDVSLTEGTLRVRHAMQRVDGKPRLIEPKTKKSRRTLSLPAPVVAALQAQRRRQLEERLLAGDRWRDWDLVFTSTIGTPLEPTNVLKRLQALLEGAALPRQRFHDLRHCCASLLLAQGVSARVVMEMLGHSQIALTMDTYSHVMPAMLNDAATALEAAFAVGG